MYSQTIALFSYLLLGILNRRFWVLLVILYLSGLFLSSFTSELAMLNSQAIAAGFLADFIRYTLVLLILLVVTTNVAEDFEIKQFERLLTMPVSRWQYIAAQYLVIAATALFLVLPSLLVLPLHADIESSCYWVVALWLEVLLMGLIGFLAVLSLEKVPAAVILSLAIYLLSKLSGLISQILSQAVIYSEGEFLNQFAETIFGLILFVLPGLESFAQNDVFFQEIEIFSVLVVQAQNVLVYAVFVLFVCLVDFYRKEFNF